MSGEKTEIAKKVTVSHDGRPSVDPNYLIQTREAQAHLKAIEKVVVSDSLKVVVSDSPKKATDTATSKKDR